MKKSRKNEPILDFSTPPSDDTKLKVKGGDFSRSLNDVLATQSALLKMDVIISEIDTSFLNTYTKEQYDKLDTLGMNNARTNLIPICTINKNGVFTLEPWAKALFPKKAHKDIENFMRSFCELSFSAIYKENGELQDDLVQYMNTHFGNNILAKAPPKQLLNTAALALTPSFGIKIANLMFEEQETASRQQTIQQKVSPAERKSTLLGTLNNSFLGLLDNYLEVKFNLIKTKTQNDLKSLQKKPDYKLKALTKRHSQILSALKADILAKSATIPNLEEKIPGWYAYLEHQDFDYLKQGMQNNSELFKKNNLPIMLDKYIELSNLAIPLTNNALSTQEKIKSLSASLDVYELQQECSLYQMHLENTVETQLKNILSSNYGGNDKLNAALTKLDKLGQLSNALANPQISNANKLKKFDSDFNEESTQVIFNLDADSEEIKRLKIIGHILASVVTLGIYAGVRAIYSNKKHGYSQFWRSPEENLAIKQKEILHKNTPRKLSRHPRESLAVIPAKAGI